MFDPIYLLWVMLPSLVISGLASWAVRSAFSRYSKVTARSGLTGAQAAQRLLDGAGIHDVRVVPTHGYLSDHYNPATKELALSESVFHSRSVAAIGVATHEAGHAIQHARGYWPLAWRSAIVPLAQYGSSLGYIAMAIGLFMTYGSSNPVFGKWIVGLGAILFSAMLLFQLITLPVEFNASTRAKNLVLETGIIRSDEQRGIHAVLNAAAMTYVAAAISTLLTLLYFLFRAGILGGRDE